MASRFRLETVSDENSDKVNEAGIGSQGSLCRLAVSNKVLQESECSVLACSSDGVMPVCKVQGGHRAIREIRVLSDRPGPVVPTAANLAASR